MNAPERLPRLARPHVMKRMAVGGPSAAGAWRGCWVWDTDGKNISMAGRHRRQPRSAMRTGRMPAPDRGRSASWIQLPTFSCRCQGRSRGAKLCELSGLQRVLLQHRPRGQRGALRLAASTAMTRASNKHGSWLRGRVPRPLASPRCRHLETPRSRPASARWSRASCAAANDLGRSKNVAATNRTCRGVLRGDQGEGGVKRRRSSTEGGAQSLRQRKAGADATDEVQCGMGRTGKVVCHTSGPASSPT